MTSHYKVIVRESDGSERRFACGSLNVCTEQARRENACAFDSGRAYRVEPCAACEAAAL